MKAVKITPYKRMPDGADGSLSGAGFVDLSSKLDKAIWEKEFEPMEDCLVHKRTALFKGLVVFDEYDAGGGGGGADLPVGVLGDVLYHDGASWVAKQASTLGFATQSWVEAQSYATQTWVTNKGYLTGITKAQVLGVMSGSGSASQYLAGNGTFYTVGYGELSGTPDLSVYALKSKVITLDGNVSTNRANNMGNETWFDYSFGGSGIAGSAISFSPTGGGYATQISASYAGNEFAFRTYNGDSRVWTAVRRVWHDGNAGTSANDWSAKNINATQVSFGDVVLVNYQNRLGVLTADNMYARGISVDSLLCSYSYSDYIHVPENGIFIRGRARMWKGVDVEDVNAVSNFSGTTNINGTLFCKGLVVVNSY